MPTNPDTHSRRDRFWLADQLFGRAEVLSSATVKVWCRVNVW